MGMRGDKKIQDRIDFDIKGPKTKQPKTFKKTWKVNWDSKIGNIFKKLFRR